MEATNQALLTVLAKLQTWELKIGHMYRDGAEAGNVAVGIGYLISDDHQACALPFMVGDRRAQPDEITADFARVMSYPPGLPAVHYAGTPRVYLTEDGIVDEGIRRLRALLPHLAQLYPGFYGFPEPVQECLIDLGWNLGAGELATWHRLAAALNSVPPDFTVAADEVHCATSRDGRNNWRRQQMLAGGQRND